ncbi:MAG TPA: glutamine--fructose-6-phosphate transaminase (isomerizing) [Pseudomonadales bacterium]|nr:glutamine--fructose-6-phosphate transaminase (isomerizing) [Pseudomonadales bacterium]HNL24438.1 glutamine--fructose-6-phosphate transaminase (isomerizing) [Pseudomonadales bacterium]HNN64885.1 glutamine--fructose-6-phosphate transaminase (isomerizing) [Pseudomonadales bacterium]
MCGIVGAVAERPVSEILMEGLRRLEYRGYDSAGIAVIDPACEAVGRHRRQGKVQNLAEALAAMPLAGVVGIAHTRWATHGQPNESNAHPHMSGERLALVHNGIIENHQRLRRELIAEGYRFDSETDTEVVVHLIHQAYQQQPDLQQAVRSAVARLEGAFALGVIHCDQPHLLVGARKGSPLVVGVGIGENFIASDPLALRQVTDRFIYLEEGDLVTIGAHHLTILDEAGTPVERPVVQLEQPSAAAEKGHFRHFMLKEIYEQPAVIKATFDGRITEEQVLTQLFGVMAEQLFPQVRAVQIVACGTSFHAGLVAKYWIEALAGLPCQVEVASEYRYRKQAVRPGALLVAISQSGETADTLAALRMARQLDYLATLAICNVPASSLVREADLVFMTQAGPEIGVASTKAFTTQLVGLMLLTLVLAKHNGLERAQEREVVQELWRLPMLVEAALNLDDEIKATAEHFADKRHALFLGRGHQYPVAMEGALKLKEISYIHAEAYPAGELKHGPLALVDSEMPVITVAPNNELLEKLKSNLQEVKARGGELYVFADRAARAFDEENCHVVAVPEVSDLLAPIIYTIPLQLLAYHVAVLKGTDVDQPRNLAKSVTVE